MGFHVWCARVPDADRRAARLADDGKPSLHLHAVLGLRDGTTRGGHFLKGIVRPTLEVADIVRSHGEEFRQAHAESLSVRQKRVLRAIERCRTAALGGHLEQCDQCGHERNAYNSCADRHCPKCQSLARAKWLEKRQAELLDCEYFHVVFTLPAELATIPLAAPVAPGL